MVKKNRTNNFLFFLIVLNILIRLIAINYEIGWDSYFIHELAFNIKNNNYVKFIITPLSVFGYYPFSYASGIPILLAELDKILNLNLSIIILLVSIFFGTFSVISIYLLAKKLKFNEIESFLSAFIFSTSLNLLFLTTFSISTRGPFIVILPLFLYTILNFNYKINKWKKIFLLFVLITLLALFHHMFVFCFYFIVLYFIAKFLHNKIPFFPLYLVSFLALGLMAFFKIGSYFTEVEYSNVFSLLFYLLLRYLRANGFWLFFALFFAFVLSLKNKKNFEESFLLIILFGFIPLAHMATYLPTLNLVIISLLGAKGFYHFIPLITKITNKKIANFFVISTIVLSIFLSALLQFWHPGIIEKQDNSFDRTLTKKDIYIAKFIDSKIEGNIMTDDLLFSSRINTILPCRFISREAANLNCNYEKIEEANITRISFFSEEAFADYPFKIEQKVNYISDYLIRNKRYNDKELIAFRKKHNFNYLIQNKLMNKEYNIYDSINKIYNNYKYYLFDFGD